MVGNEAALVAGLVEGRPRAEIAQTAGLSISTVQRREQDPEIQRQVQQARTDQRTQALGRLTKMRAAALDRLESLVDSENDSVALAAVRLVLSAATQVEQAHDLSERISKLEEAADAEAEEEAQDGFVEPGDVDADRFEDILAGAMQAPRASDSAHSPSDLSEPTGNVPREDPGEPELRGSEASASVEGEVP